MKKIISIRLLVLTIVTSMGITSCSKDEDSNSVKGDAKVSSFLKSFYSNDFQLGNSINIKIVKNASISKSIDFDDAVVTEVFVGDEERARGYIITNKETNLLLYFADVDRIDYKMTTIDFELSETKITYNIDDFEKYLSTNEFDMIKVTQDYIAELNSSDDKRSPSFGWVYEQGPCGEAGPGLAYVYHNYYFLGIRLKHIKQYSLTDSNEPLVEPCGFRASGRISSQGNK